MAMRPLCVASRSASFSGVASSAMIRGVTIDGSLLISSQMASASAVSPLSVALLYCLVNILCFVSVRPRSSSVLSWRCCSHSSSGPSMSLTFGDLFSPGLRPVTR
jgi:hypothetical protein